MVCGVIVVLLFMKMDVVQLISRVEEYPELYDIRNPHYYNSQRRNYCWEDIGCKMSHQGMTFTGAECKKRWNKIRNCYRKAFLRRRTTRGQSATLRYLRFEKELTFLSSLFDDEKYNTRYSTSEYDSVDEKRCQDNKTEARDHISDEVDYSASPPTSSDAITFESGISSLPRGLISPTLTSPSETTFSTNSRKRFGRTLVDRVVNAEDSLADLFRSMEKTVRELPIPVQVKMKEKLFTFVNRSEQDFVLKKRLFLNNL